MPSGAAIGALQGGIAGAQLGSAGGPWGAAGGAVAGALLSVFGGDDDDAAEHQAREIAFRTRYGFAAPTGIHRTTLVPQRIQAIIGLLNDTGRHFIARLNDFTGGPPGGGESVVFNVDSVGDLPVPNAAGFPQFVLQPSPWRTLVNQVGARDSEVLALVNAGVIRFEGGRVRLIPPAQPAPPAAPPVTEEDMGVGADLGSFVGGVRDFFGALGGGARDDGWGPTPYPSRAPTYPTRQIFDARTISADTRALADPRVFPDYLPGLPGVDIVREGMCPTLYRPGGQSIRPVKRIMQQNPLRPERIEVWEHRGTPVLYSGDYGCAKRVARVARKAGRRRGR